MIAALSNHLWQSTLFALAVSLLTTLFHRNHARVRYWLWLTASLKFLVPFALLIGVGRQLPWPADWHAAPPVVSAGVMTASEPFVDDGGSVSLTASTAPQSSARWLPVVLIGAWLIGAAMIVLARIRDWRRLRVTIAQSTPYRLSNVEIPDQVSVRSAPGLLEPGVVGWRYPVLLLPSDIADHLTSRQLAAVVAHELCHVARRDNLTAAAHMSIESIFWFHPLVWWIGSRLLVERERACDEAVMERLGDGQTYAEAILAVCKRYVETPLTCVSGVSGADLRVRLDAIIRNRMGVRLTGLKRAVLAAAVISAFALPLLVGSFSQAALRPALDTQEANTRFDVVSLRIDPAGATPRLIPRLLQFLPGGRFRPPTPISLRQLILLAYRSDIMASELKGGPDWWTSEAYDLNARADAQVFAQAVTAQDRSRLLERMVRSLLEDRFHLRVKAVPIETDVWTLTVAKGGVKLVGSKNLACGINDRPGPHCHFKSGQITRGLVGESVTLADMIEALQENVLRERVVDRTGLSGMFDVNVAWRLEAHQDPNAPTPEGQDSDAPDVFTALQEQAGLRLERRKGPGMQLIVEGVEHPITD